MYTIIHSHHQRVISYDYMNDGLGSEVLRLRLLIIQEH